MVCVDAGMSQTPELSECLKDEESSNGNDFDYSGPFLPGMDYDQWQAAGEERF